MKKEILVAVMLTASVAFTQAQPRRMNPEDAAKRQTEMLEKKLSLSAEQKQKVYDIMLASSKSRDSLMTAVRDGNGDRQAAFSKMKDLQAANDVKLGAVLNDTQKADYKKWVEERQARMQERRSGGGRPE